MAAEGEEEVPATKEEQAARDARVPRLDSFMNYANSMGVDEKGRSASVAMKQDGVVPDGLGKGPGAAQREMSSPVVSAPRNYDLDEVEEDAKLEHDDLDSLKKNIKIVEQEKIVKPPASANSGGGLFGCCAGNREE